MPNLQAVLREEIARLARKEIKKEVSTLKKQSAQYRRDIAALKRTVDKQGRELDFLRGREKSRLVEEPDADVVEDARFSPAWLRTHREKLGLSAADYGRLVGVSGLSIYNYESEKSVPRTAQKAKLAAVRGLGKREAQQRLTLLDE